MVRRIEESEVVVLKAIGDGVGAHEAEDCGTFAERIDSPVPSPPAEYIHIHT